ncbi:hypothetical protein ACFL0H_14170 [Thermodesulfobacteriota bacterium]
MVQSSPRRRLYPPAWKPYGLEAEPEAIGVYKPKQAMAVSER